ncbi:hypothetical protein AB0L59_27940 [Streptomyces sp. NPDC052109]|uniref:hypothetical protein n=1 Tax=Streptomyces sp. NPDC052109 TaxID=3155527 RepID=UPI00343F1A05
MTTAASALPRQMLRHHHARQADLPTSAAGAVAEQHTASLGTRPGLDYRAHRTR